MLNYDFAKKNFEMFFSKKILTMLQFEEKHTEIDKILK